MNTLRKIICMSALIALTCFSSADVKAWGQLGHATVGQIAQDHLTPKARKALKKYLGYSLAFYASDADAYRSVWTLDLGFVPTNPEASRVSFLKDFDFTTPLNISPWSHSVTVDSNFKCFPTDNLDGAYINNVAYYVTNLAKELHENAENMDPYERYKALVLIIHFIGDMHCPMHIVYLPDNTVKGHISITYKGKETNLHSYWDSKMFDSYYPKSFRDMAYLADNASRKEFKEITKGDVFDWAGRTAEQCWPLHNVWKDGDTIHNTYGLEIREIALNQLRDAGYRLAAVMNGIFK